MAAGTFVRKVARFALTVVIAFVVFWVVGFVLMILSGEEFIRDDDLASRGGALVILGLAAAAAVLLHWPRSAALDAEVEARKARLAKTHASGCRLCGAEDAKTYSTEYGWYAEEVFDASDAFRKHVQTTKRYLRLGDAHVRLCPRCVIAEMESRRRSSAITAKGALKLGLPFFLISFALLDGFALFGLRPFRLPFVYTGSGDLELAALILIAVAAVSGLSLLYALGVFVGWLMRRGRPLTSERGLADVDAFARSWFWTLVNAEIEAPYEDVDPYYIFHPNADPASYRSWRDDNGDLCCITKRHRRYKMKPSSARIDDRFWIAPREPHLDAWETEPLETRQATRMEILDARLREQMAELTRIQQTALVMKRLEESEKT